VHARREPERGVEHIETEEALHRRDEAEAALRAILVVAIRFPSLAAVHAAFEDADLADGCSVWQVE
jgi:hypothetical protein